MSVLLPQPLSRHHDAGHEGAQLPCHADRDEVRHVDAGSERLELHRAHEGEHRPDQEVDERHDPERPHARGLEGVHQVHPPEAGSPAQQHAESEARLSQEADPLGLREQLSVAIAAAVG